MKPPRITPLLISATLAFSALSPASAQLAEGLVNYWNFEGNFNDTAGALLGNASTAEDNGTPVDDTLVTIQEGGPLGKFGNFVSSHVEVPDSEDVLAGGESLSISIWFRVAAFDTTWQALIAKGEQNNYRVARNNASETMSYAGGTGDIGGGPTVTDGEWHHLVAMSEAGVSTRLWVDGGLVATGGAPTITDTATGNLSIGANPGATGRDWDGDIDDVVMWNRALTDEEIGTIYESGLVGISISGLLTITDTDNDDDGLPNVWEMRYGLNPNSAVGNDGAAGDPDGDTLTNAVEYSPHGTDPSKADTDDDGLGDGVEINVRLTDPNVADTDKDGRLDGQEVTAGTNPLKADTDSDGVNDGIEVADGTDPLVPNTGWNYKLVAYWPLDADYNSTVNGHTATANGTEPNIPFAPGKFGNGIQLDGIDQFLMVDGEENDFDFSGGQNLTVSAWFTADTIDKDWQCLIAKGEGEGWRIHRRGADQPPELSFGGGAGDTPRHNVPMSVGDGTIHHVAAISEHGVNERLYFDGILVATGGAPTLENRANAMRIGSNPDTNPGRFWTGLIDDVALWSRVLSESEVGQIWNAGQGRSVQELLGPVVQNQLQFTQVVYNQAADQFTLTWTSSPGKTYSLKYSTNLTAFNQNVSTTIASGGASTSFGPFANPTPGGSQIFFKATEN